MLALLKLIPLRYWEYLGLIIAIIGFILFYNAHERAIGRAKIEAQIQQAQQEMQTRLDASAQEQNAQIEAKFNATTYTPFDYKLPADCGAVPDNIRMRVNQSHKTP